jgi:CO/xanthine dehydrogenase Mo-binding subunit
MAFFSKAPRDAGDILTGRGFAYPFRGQTIAAEIAEVEVNRKTGHVWVERLVCAYDCGLVVNPEALRRTVECSMLHSLSRTLHEEVQFDTEKVTSVDRIDVVLVNGDPNPKRPDLAPYGGGETACEPMLAAVANAIYDATGVRLRRIPFRDARVHAALQTARV